MKARVIVWLDCDRNCQGCCNNTLDFQSIPVITERDLLDCKEVMLTGGEPLLFPAELMRIARQVYLTTQMDSKMYLYTAGTEQFLIYLKTSTALFFKLFDGVTYSIHKPEDVELFLKYDKAFKRYRPIGFKFRVRNFSGVTLDKCLLHCDWDIQDLEWSDNCTIPKGETLFKWEKKCERK